MKIGGWLCFGKCKGGFMVLTHESTLSIDNVEPSSVQIIQVIIAHLFGPQSRGRHLRRTVLALVLNFFQEPKRFNLTDKYLWTQSPGCQEKWTVLELVLHLFLEPKRFNLTEKIKIFFSLSKSSHLRWRVVELHIFISFLNTVGI